MGLVSSVEIFVYLASTAGPDTSLRVVGYYWACLIISCARSWLQSVDVIFRFLNSPFCPSLLYREWVTPHIRLARLALRAYVTTRILRPPLVTLESLHFGGELNLGLGRGLDG